ncbi:ras guanine nucleotide exchange factor domain-containing protein [Gorgonomyces haynaldii]|nr:ras guanine nucleotide exchange factor domain-containing protein [Gorgonomyces haynaldii]
MLIAVVGNHSEWMVQSGCRQLDQSVFELEQFQFVVENQMTKGLSIADACLYLKDTDTYQESEVQSICQTMKLSVVLVCDREDIKESLTLLALRYSFPCRFVSDLKKISLLMLSLELEKLVGRKPMKPKRDPIKMRLQSMQRLSSQLKLAFYGPPESYDPTSSSSTVEEEEKKRDACFQTNLPIDALKLHPEGSLPSELIRYMVDGQVFDLDFAKVFFLCYPKFMSPSELLDRLLDYFDSMEDTIDAPHLRICNVIILWLTLVGSDFNDHMRFTLLVFVHVLSKIPDFGPIVQRMANQLSASMLPPTASWGFLPPIPHFEPSKSLKAVALPMTWILEIESEILAQHLTMIEWESFSKIHPRDYMQQVWGKPPHPRSSASVTNSVDHFNFMSSFASTAIIMERTSKSRAKMIAKLMRVSQWLRSMNNYKTLMAFILGIKASAIGRLRQTWKFLDQKEFVKDFEALESLMSSEKSFSRYRDALQQSELPCIPYLGVFQRDLIYMDETQQDKKMDGTINFNKYVQMGDVLLYLQNFQLVQHQFKTDKHLMDKIRTSGVVDDAEAFQISLELEPRN